jgi:ATP-dependent RNA helicase DDX24/MAK5
MASSRKNGKHEAKPNPWQKIDSIEGNFTEGGYSGLETIPAGTYNLIRDERGSWVIKNNPVVSTEVDDMKVQLHEVNPKLQNEKKNKKRRNEEISARNSKKTLVDGESIHSSITREPVVDESLSSWIPFSLHPFLLSNLSRRGFVSPTPIQEKVMLPAIQSYRDVIGIAETGSGKTLAYGLPILHRLFERRDRLGIGILKSDPNCKWWKYLPALVITPTRELAVQVQSHLKDMLPSESIIQIGVLVGGLSAEKQQSLLAKHPDIIIATPGRLWDLVKSGCEFLSRLDLLQVSMKNTKLVL